MGYKGGKIIFEELSYKIQGVLMEVRKIYGPGHKELLYNNAIEELFIRDRIIFKREPTINIISPITKKIIGKYRPDFIVDEKIIIESKAVEIIPKNFIDQIYSYLRVSEYELGIFVNFRSPKLYIKRIILTNDRKGNVNNKYIIN